MARPALALAGAEVHQVPLPLRAPTPPYGLIYRREPHVDRLSDTCAGDQPAPSLALPFGLSVLEPGTPRLVHWTLWVALNV